VIAVLSHRRKLAACRRDADQDGGRAQSEALLELPDDGSRAAEPEHLLHRAAGALAVEHRNDALREVTDTRIRGLGRERAELTVGDDKKAVLTSFEHQAAVEGPTVSGKRRSVRLRRSVSTAEAVCAVSP